MSEIKRLHIAKSPCMPTHGIVVEYEDGRELWDCDCASDSEEKTLELVRQEWPEHEVVMWDNPLHYSNSQSCAADVRYLRSRSRWTQELEDELIRLHKEGKPPNMNEFGCSQKSPLEAELEKKYGAKK